MLTAMLVAATMLLMLLAMAGRRSAFVIVAVAVARVAILPSCDLRISSGTKSVYPPVGIVPWRFLPGSVCVPFRLRPLPGHNPPYPTLSVGGIGLMKGTPGIVDSASLEAVVRLVTSKLLICTSPDARSSSPLPMLVALVIVLGVNGANIGVTTTRGGMGGRQGRRSREFNVRQRRRAPGFTHFDVAGGLLNVGVTVVVRSVLMTMTAMASLVAAVASSVDQGGVGVHAWPCAVGVGVLLLGAHWAVKTGQTRLAWLRCFEAQPEDEVDGMR